MLQDRILFPKHLIVLITFEPFAILIPNIWCKLPTQMFFPLILSYTKSMV